MAERTDRRFDFNMPPEVPSGTKKSLVLAILQREFEDQRANSIDPGEAANEPPGLDLHCLQSQLIYCLVLEVLQISPIRKRI